MSEKIITDNKCRYISKEGICNAFSNPSQERSCEDVPLKLCKNKQILNLKQENKALNNELLGLRKGAEISEWRDRAIKAEKSLKEIAAILSKYIGNSMVCPIPVLDVKNIKAQIDEVLDVRN